MPCVQRNRAAAVQCACRSAFIRDRLRLRRGRMPKVRDAIRVVEEDGWEYQRMRGDHRIYKHPRKAGIVVIAGHARDDLPEGTWQSIQRQAGLKGAKEQR